MKPVKTRNEYDYKQSVEEYLLAGGRITKCPAGRAVQVLEGSMVIDGETFSFIPAGTEAVPQMTKSTLEQYDRGMAQAIRPYHHLAWQDIARETAPSEARRQWERRLIDADEIDYVEQE